MQTDRHNEANGPLSQTCERAWTRARMRVQVSVPSPSTTSQCLPKWIVVHRYKIKTPIVHTTSFRPRPSIKTKSCGIFMKFSVQILHTKLSSNGFVKTDQWHWHLTKWCTRTATRSVRTSLPIWVELSTDDLHLMPEYLAWISSKPVQSKPRFS